MRLWDWSFEHQYLRSWFWQQMIWVKFEDEIDWWVEDEQDKNWVWNGADVCWLALVMEN